LDHGKILGNTNLNKPGPAKMITTIDSHKVRCGNVMDGIDNLMDGEKADIFYSDPPWGQGNLNYWRTINERHTGRQTQSIPLPDFLDQIFNTAMRHTSGPVFIEYGIKWKEPLIAKALELGLRYNGTADIKYRSGNKMLPHQLHIFSTTMILLKKGYLESLNGMTGIECLKKAIEPFIVPGGIILDPCCGLGMTAQLAKASGMRFRGNELNPKRLSQAILKLK
jgi:hypothetical protein